MATRQTAAKYGVANEAFNVSVFDQVDLRQNDAENDAIRNPNDSLNIIYATKDYLDQYRDLNLFYEEYAKELLLKPCITYTVMKKLYPIKINDLGLSRKCDSSGNSFIRRVQRRYR